MRTRRLFRCQRAAEEISIDNSLITGRNEDFQAVKQKLQLNLQIHQTVKIFVHSTDKEEMFDFR